VAVVVDGRHTGGRVIRLQVMAVHLASDNMDEHAEGVHVALSSTAWYRNQKEGQQLVIHDCEH
jgi:hypothetical protein